MWFPFTPHAISLYLFTDAHLSCLFTLHAHTSLSWSLLHAGADEGKGYELKNREDGWLDSDPGLRRRWRRSALLARGGHGVPGEPEVLNGPCPTAAMEPIEGGSRASSSAEERHRVAYAAPALPASSRLAWRVRCDTMAWYPSLGSAVALLGVRGPCLVGLFLSRGGSRSQLCDGDGDGYNWCPRRCLFFFCSQGFAEYLLCTLSKSHEHVAAAFFVGWPSDTLFCRMALFDTR